MLSVYSEYEVCMEHEIYLEHLCAVSIIAAKVRRVHPLSLIHI